MDCIFCKIVNKEIPTELIYESEHVVAFADISPAAPTHYLVIPRKHISSLNDIEPSDAPAMAEIFQAAKNIAQEKGFSDDGYRVVMNTGEHGGQTVFHIHLHLLAGRPLSWPPG